MSGAYLLYYLRPESQIWYVDASWDDGVSFTIYGTGSASVGERTSLIITFPENLFTTSGLSLLLHGVISLPDSTSYDKKNSQKKHWPGKASKRYLLEGLNTPDVANPTRLWCGLRQTDAWLARKIPSLSMHHLPVNANQDTKVMKQRQRLNSTYNWLLERKKSNSQTPGGPHHRHNTRHQPDGIWPDFVYAFILTRPKLGLLHCNWHFSQICNRVMSLDWCQIFVSAHYLEKKLIEFCVYIDIDMIYIVIVRHHFSHICNRVMILDWCQIFVSDHYLQIL